MTEDDWENEFASKRVSIEALKDELDKARNILSELNKAVRSTHEIRDGSPEIESALSSVEAAFADSQRIYAKVRHRYVEAVKRGSVEEKSATANGPPKPVTLDDVKRQWRDLRASVRNSDWRRKVRDASALELVICAFIITALVVIVVAMLAFVCGVYAAIGWLAFWLTGSVPFGVAVGVLTFFGVPAWRQFRATRSKGEL